MRHEYIDIPAQPDATRELYYKRQDLVKRLGEASIVLCEATNAHNDIISQLIELNAQIVAAEG